MTAGDETVHQAEKLGYDSLFHFADYFRALGGDGVDLVNEQNGRCMARRFLKNLAELGLTLAVELAHDLRAIEMNKVNAAFSSHGACQQSLSSTRGTIQEDALGRQNSQALENARVLQREFDDFAHARHFTLESANIFVRNGRCSRRGLLAFHHADVGAFSDYHRSRGNRAHNLEIHGLGESRYSHDAASDDRDVQQIFKHTLGGNDRGRGTHPQRR